MKKINEQITESEKAHLQSMHDLKSSIRRGDWIKVQEKTGLTSTAHAIHCFNRINSKRHLAVYNALHEVVTERIEELNANTK